MDKKIFSQIAGEERRSISASIDVAGDLRLEAQDLGPTAEKFWGESEYEFSVIVRSSEKDHVLLMLLEKAYGGHSGAVDEFRADLKAHDIEHAFSNW